MSGIVKSSVSDLYKGLVLDMPLTSKWLQSASIASDKSAYHTHVEAMGTATYGADGVTLDGNSDYLLGNEAGWRSSDNVGTISAWVNFTGVGNNPAILGTADESFTTVFWVFYINSSGELSIQDEAVHVISTTQSLTANTWYHVAASSNGSRWLLYINGESAPFSVVSGSDTGKWFGDVNNRDSFTIGALRRSSVGSYFGGIISGVDVWERELSTAEISKVYAKDRP